jgi:hypothetical protein
MAYPLAMAHGEDRLELEGPVSPRLADGARVAMAAVAGARPELRPTRLDLDERVVVATRDRRMREAALCLSGGVDALAALRQNLDTVPAEHPARFRTGIFVFGLNTYDFADGKIVAARERAVWDYVDAMEQFAQTAGLSIVRMRTNLRTLYPSFESWGSVTHGAHLSALGQSLRQRVHALAIGSAGKGLGEGTMQNPLLVQLYSSDDVNVYGAQNLVSRLDKMRSLLAWPEALRILRVCFQIDEPVAGQRNCGRCEKCLRTMLQFIALGGGDSPDVRGAFARWVDADALKGLDLRAPHQRAFYSGLAPLLVAKGRSDLAAALARANTVDRA